MSSLVTLLDHDSGVDVHGSWSTTVLTLVARSVKVSMTRFTPFSFVFHFHLVMDGRPDEKEEHTNSDSDEESELDRLLEHLLSLLRLETLGCFLGHCCNTIEGAEYGEEASDTDQHRRVRAYVFKSFHTGQNHDYTNEESPQSDTAADTPESSTALLEGVLGLFKGKRIVELNVLLGVQNGVA